MYGFKYSYSILIFYIQWDGFKQLFRFDNTANITDEIDNNMYSMTASVKILKYRKTQNERVCQRKLINKSIIYKIGLLCIKCKSMTEEFNMEMHDKSGNLGISVRE